MREILMSTRESVRRVQNAWVSREMREIWSVWGIIDAYHMSSDQEFRIIVNFEKT